jgi:hypothetical protein
MNVTTDCRCARRRPRMLAAVLVFAAAWPLVGGCDARAPVAPVHGIVTIDGRPLRAGAVVFTPLARGEDKRVGKSAYGEIRPDGTFVLGTFTASDGAIVGMHRATILGKASTIDGPPPGATPASISGGPKPPFDALRVMGHSFEVVAGQDNEFSIDLSSRYVRQFAQRDD